ncbi:MAG: hypothetical protein ACD_75C01138G0001 [uncultured bacterium]|nr:MAG: hypothetical protein ACD_75C01138G0001 [uncultured bacterium]
MYLVVEILRDDTAWNLSPVHIFGDRQVRDKNIAKHRKIEAVVLHIEQHFLKFSSIKADLGDNIIGPGRNFAVQLEILHEQLGFQAFERGKSHAL